ncbi:hypothetical protein GCT19_15415 [Paraburkholderia sp. CNPSo 3155]|nr:hypothetical protein [Paraburkholderia atlantica]
MQLAATATSYLASLSRIPLWPVTDGGAKIAARAGEMPSAEFGSFIATVACQRALRELPMERTMSSGVAEYGQ